MQQSTRSKPEIRRKSSHSKVLRSLQHRPILRKDGKLPDTVQHRQVKYLNNVIEADHGKLR